MRTLTAVVVGLLTLVCLCTGVTSARADDSPAPVWSGLDVRSYSGPIPGRVGTLMAQVPLATTVSLPDAARAYRYQYSTLDQHGRIATSTAAVFIPKGTPPPGGWPVIAWAHGTTGLADQCTPSALPRSARDHTYLGHWLQQGYAIVASDYVGLGTPGLMPYLDGRTTAHNVVESVIAAQQLGQPLARKWAIVGQSQGGAGAMNAARYATEFSRGSGLDYRGVVGTGVPANLEYIFEQVGPSVPPLTLPAALNVYTAYLYAGFADARPAVDIAGALTEKGRQRLRLAAAHCYEPLAAALTGDDVRTWWRTPLQSLPGAAAALRDYMRTPSSGYDRPIFLGQGLLDTDVPAPSALSLYGQMRAADQPVTLHVYPDKDHSGTVLASMRDSTPWLASIMR